MWFATAGSASMAEQDSWDGVGIWICEKRQITEVPAAAIVGTRVFWVGSNPPRPDTMSAKPLDYYLFNPAGHIISVAISTLASSFPRVCQWDVDKMPDLQGDVAIVTGGNTGIGKETCKVLVISSRSVESPDFIAEALIWNQALLNKNAKVYLAARNEQKAFAAIEELEKETGKKAHYLRLDLASLKSVKASAETFLR